MGCLLYPSVYSMHIAFISWTQATRRLKQRGEIPFIVKERTKSNYELITISIQKRTKGKQQTEWPCD